MILQCSFEELNALRDGAHVVLKSGLPGTSAVAAPPESQALVGALVHQLSGSLSIQTLAEQQAVEGAVNAIVEQLRAAMEARILAQHPGDESAVTSYFEFGHALAVHGRLRVMGAEMEALIELATGRPPDEETASTFIIPD